jgi:cytochrome c biogenesis protein CcmG, thiol:disulfide interchange protein DsbE
LIKKIFLLFLFFTTVVLSQADKNAPDFKLPDLNGNNVELSKMTGKGPLLINFWATWCKPCVEEMAEYAMIYNEYKSKGFEMLAVSVDNEKTADKVKPYAESKKYPFTILMDIKAIAAKKYSIQAIPMTFLLNKEGKIVYQSLGFEKGDELKLRKKIEELLD